MSTRKKSKRAIIITRATSLGLYDAASTSTGVGEHDGGIRKKGTSQGTEARVSQMGDWTLVMLYGHKFLHDRALLSLCSFRYVKTFAPIYLTPRNDPVGACTAVFAAHRAQLIPCAQ